MDSKYQSEGSLMTIHSKAVDETEAKNREDLNRQLPYQCYEQSFTSKNYFFYLSDIVEEPRQYVDMVHMIKTATPNDIIYIMLNTGGGRLDTGVQIINAMRTTQAKVVSVLESEAHSLGTLIFLAADEFIVHDNCLMMFHNFSGGTIGKGNEMAAQVEATVKWFAKLARNIYSPFLSQDEIDRILRGEDLWMDSDEIRKRLDAMIKNLEKEANKKNKAAKAPRKNSKRS